LSFRVFVDADVILDLLLSREPFLPSARALFMLIQKRGVEGYVSPLILSNLFYILRKGSTGPQALSAVRKLRLILGVLPMDERTVDLALASSFTDLEDAFQYYAAVEQNLDALITRNKKDYQVSDLPISDLPILTAEEFVTVYRAQGH
jgi:predicted nucleic acid-binding protein